MIILLIIQILLSIILSVTVLLQSQGGGLSSAFTGQANYHTKRGIEKGIFIFTIVLGVLFTLTSFLNLL